MSDDEWQDDSAGNDDGWGDEFEEEDSGGNEESEEDALRIQIENLFYEAEDARRSNPSRALKQFEECVELTRSAGKDFMEKRFKSLEHIVILLLQLNQSEKMIDRYQELLSFASEVTRNEYADAINKVLNSVSDSSLQNMEKIYSISLHHLKQMGNQERLWFNTNLKLCKTYMAIPNLDRAEEILRELHTSCLAADGVSDDKVNKGSQLLEIYALEFQLHSERKDNARLKFLFGKTKDLVAEINDPRSMSVIRECWGKMYANDGRWADAFAEFFQAFKQYQEIGHARAKQCLKYVVIAGLLSQNQVNPFDAQEAKVYERTPEIQAMVSLRAAYERGDIAEVESILRKNRSTILDDAFICEHLDSILTHVRSQTLRDLIRPYRTVRLRFLADKLMIDEAAVQALLMRLILDEKVHGKIDQINGILDLSSASSEDSTFNAFSHWASAIEAAQKSISNRLAF